MRTCARRHARDADGGPGGGPPLHGRLVLCVLVVGSLVTVATAPLAQGVAPRMATDGLDGNDGLCGSDEDVRAIVEPGCAPGTGRGDPEPAGAVGDNVAMPVEGPLAAVPDVVWATVASYGDAACAPGGIVEPAATEDAGGLGDRAPGSVVHDDAATNEDASARIDSAPVLDVNGRYAGIIGYCRSVERDDTVLLIRDKIDLFRIPVRTGDVVAVHCNVPGGRGSVELPSGQTEPCSPTTGVVADRPGHAVIEIEAVNGIYTTGMTGRPYTFTVNTRSPATEIDPAMDGDVLDRIATTGGLGHGSTTDAGPGTDRNTGRRVADAAAGRHVDAPMVADPPVMVLVVTAITLSAATIVLYRRVSRDEILDNDLRSAILDLVEDEPGISPTEIAGELDVVTNTVIYHARILTETDYISTERSGQRTQYFVQGAADRRAVEMLAMLRRDAKRDVLVAARREPGLSISGLARRLGKHRSTVKRHVDDLVEADVLVAEPDGNGRRISVPDALEDLDVWDTVVSGR